MDRIYVKDVIEATGGKLICGSEDQPIDGVCMDSRIADENSLFVAIPGEHTDGHEYLDAAFKKGASSAIVSREVAVPSGMACILVENSIYALQELSRWYMSNRLSMKKIAVTGSVGKTTTRDLIHAAMSSKYIVGKNERNYNSETGLPLTVLTFTRDMQVGVMEMGTSGGMEEVARLADLVRPDIAVITNIGVSHIEFLKTRENILKAKLGIAKYFTDKNTLVINGNDDQLVSLLGANPPYDIVTVGNEDALCEVDYFVADVSERGIEGLKFKLLHKEKAYDVELPIPGYHNAINAALAIAAAKVAGVSIEDAISGMANMTTTGSRLRMIDVGNIKIIDDAYNAAPDSMRSAIRTLAGADAKRRIAVLGDMNELGSNSSEMHFSIGRFVAEKEIDILIAVGEKADDIACGVEAAIRERKTAEDAPNTIRCVDRDDAFNELMNIVKEGDLVLVKASRGMALDEIAKRMEKEYSRT